MHTKTVGKYRPLVMYVKRNNLIALADVSILEKRSCCREKHRKFLLTRPYIFCIMSPIMMHTESINSHQQVDP